MSILREQRRTKIVGTLGPACAGGVMKRLLEAGMDVARRNFSHGGREEHRAGIKQLRDLSAPRGRPLAILQDLAGPKMRIGEVAGVAYPEIISDTPVGVPIFPADGQIELQVAGKTRDALHCRVTVGGVLRSQVGINFPSHSLSVPAFTAKDREDLGVEVPQERVPLIQKQIIASANRAVKPVITAGSPIGVLGATNLIKADVVP